jgi:hypothetical protein
MAERLKAMKEKIACINHSLSHIKIINTILKTINDVSSNLTVVINKLA